MDTAKRFLKIYSSQNDYDNNWLNDLEVPHVVYIEETDEVIFKDVEPKVDYSTQYFTLEAIEDTEFSFKLGDGALENNTLFYSVDNGEQWQELVIPDDEADVAKKICDCKASEKVLLKAEGVMSNSNISSSANFNIYGNAMSLIYGDNFEGQIDLSGKDNAFYYLFLYCTTLKNAENLILPATTLASNCYKGMFYGCTSLTTAPLELPATTLADGCYRSMFSNCTSLTTAPELPATTLVYSCYSNMFNGCTSLTTAPELPATTLANECYYEMFKGCTSLTTAPELHATTLADSCYYRMFYGCTSLTTAPELPATTLAEACYDQMFNNCTSLTTAPELPATTLASSCYNQMFQGCTSLTTAPELPATTLADYCYYSMFKGCSKLNYIKALFTTTPSSTYTSNWVNGVASNGTFVKNASATWNVTGSNGIPNGWTVETA